MAFTLRQLQYFISVAEEGTVSAAAQALSISQSAVTDAIKELETAAKLSPDDPAILDHLGDAYWRVGRRIEAEFQWKRVLSLDQPPKIKAEAESKLKSGLGPVTPAPAPVTAAN